MAGSETGEERLAELRHELIGLMPRRPRSPPAGAGDELGERLDCREAGDLPLADVVDDGPQPITRHTNVRAAHLTSPITGASAGQGTVGRPSMLVRVVADQLLPGADPVLAGPRRSSSTSAPIWRPTWRRCAVPAPRRCASRSGAPARRERAAGGLRVRPADEAGGYLLNAGSDWSLGGPSASGGGFGLHDATVDRGGNVWFTYNEPESATRTVGRVDTAIGRVTDFTYARPDGLAATSHGIITARDGAVWFNVNLRAPGEPANERLDRIDPRTEMLEVFTPSGDMRGMSIHVAEDAQGNIWGDTATGAIRYDPAARAFTAFTSPTQPGRTYGAAGDRDGNGWWTQIGIDVIGRGDLATGRSSEIRLPARLPSFVRDGDFSLEYLAIYAGRGRGLQAPRRPAADLATGDVWVPNYAGNNLLRIDVDTLETTYYPLPRG